MKRLVYTDNYGNRYIGGEEFDGRLTDHNILCFADTAGKTYWHNGQLWTFSGLRISVDNFYQYQKRWYELVLDAIRRI